MEIKPIVDYLEIDEFTYIENDVIKSRLSEEQKNQQLLTWDELWERVRMIIEKVKEYDNSKNMENSIEDIVDVLDSIDRNERVEGDIIPSHKVPGDELFHYDHYESTYLSVSRDMVYFVDNYYRKKKNGKHDDLPIFKVHTTGGMEAIACLINHFKIDVSEPSSILRNLYDSMKTYAKALKMENSDLFGKLFKEIGVKFEAECCV